MNIVENELDASSVQEKDNVAEEGTSSPHNEIDIMSPHLVKDEVRELEHLKKEHLKLRTKIQEIRQRRMQVKKETEFVTQNMKSWMHFINKIEVDRILTLESYSSIIARNHVATQALEETKRLNVTNDCFHIWHRGPFGTICGFRLGSEVPKLRAYSDHLVESRWTNFLTDFDKSYFFDTNTGNTSSVDNFAKVSWHEINSALGMAALLLVTLQKKPNSGFTFKSHEIIPMGRHTKIGVRQQNGKPSIMYNLYYDEDTFGTFLQLGRFKNFNIALSGLFLCLLDAAKAASQRDKAIVLPHPIQCSAKGDITIGGLSITYGATGRISGAPGTEGEQWTRAMKYFLTDLKWLVTYTTKHLDR